MQLCSEVPSTVKPASIACNTGMPVCEYANLCAIAFSWALTLGASVALNPVVSSSGWNGRDARIAAFSLVPTPPAAFSTQALARPVDEVGQHPHAGTRSLGRHFPRCQSSRNRIRFFCEQSRLRMCRIRVDACNPAFARPARMSRFMFRPISLHKSHLTMVACVLLPTAFAPQR